MAEPDLPFACNDRSPLDYIPQLADVARPRIGCKAVQHVRTEMRDPAAMLAVQIHDQCRGYRRYVLLPLPQWRQGDMENIQTIEQIFSEVFVLYSLYRRTIRRCQ